MSTLRGDDGINNKNKDEIHGGGIAEVALSRYMGTMSRHGIAAERRLRKRGDRWRVIEWIETKSSPEKNHSNSEHSNNVTEVVVYSFFAPWVTSAQHKAHSFTAKTNRLTTRDQVRVKNDNYVHSRLSREKDVLQTSQTGLNSPNHGSARNNTDKSLPLMVSIPSTDRSNTNLVSQVGGDTGRS